MVDRKLSITEERVIGQLDLNARSRLKEIGRRIKRSEQIVSYTMHSLLKSGAIKGFYPLIDYSRLGVLNFRVFFRLNYISEEKFEKFKEFLLEDPHTMWVAICGGRYDMLCTFGARNPSQFNKLLRKIMADFSEQIQGYSILTTIVVRMLSMKYLTAARTHADPIMIGGDREPAVLSERDILILSEMSGDARKSSVDIARVAGCDARTVVSRLRELEASEVVRGYRVFIDFSQVNYIKNVLLVKYHNISVEDEERLMAYLNSQPNVPCVTKTLGEWDLEITIEAKDRWEFKGIERDMREKFLGIIHMTENVPIYREFKKTYFPAFILDDPGRKPEERAAKKPNEGTRRPA